MFVLFLLCVCRVMEAKTFDKPSLDSLLTHVYAADVETKNNQEYPDHIRMPDFAKSFWKGA